MEQLIGLTLVVSLALSSAGAWLTHVVVCFREEMWGFLLAGALIIPLGVLHGFAVWFG